MIKTNSYYRTRIEAINYFISKNGKEKKSLQNGFVPESIKKDFQKWIDENKVSDDKPLSFSEITTYSTWFDMHPEKVAGEMIESTSLYFPVKVKGNRNDVEKLFENSIIEDSVDEIELMEMEAEALIIKLKLLKL